MIELENVHVRYGTHPVLQGLSAGFPPGRVTSIVGPNGCGKSTLLKTITGLCPPAQGTIRIGGVPLTQLTPRQVAQQVAYLPQSRSIPSLSVERMVLHGRFAHLSYPRRYRRQDLEAAEQALAWVGAQDLRDKSLSELSGGQRQKIYIAMSLAQDAETILLDEPTTYLDIRSQMEILSLIRKLAAMGKAVVLVLHDLHLVMRYTDHVLLLRDGKIAAEGSPHAIYESGELERSFGISLQYVQTPQGAYYLPHL